MKGVMRMAKESPKVEGKSERYERLLRGEISSEQYVDALKREASSHRASRSTRATRVARGASA